MVTSSSSTHEFNSVEFISNGYWEDGGMEKAVSAYDKTSYSFDYKIEALGGSIYSMAVWDSEYLNVASFRINYINGNVRIYNGGVGFENTTLYLTPNTWYNFKMNVDMTAKTVEYFVNNISYGVKNIQAAATGFNFIDFYYDDFDSGFSVDNIKIENNDLSTPNHGMASKVTIAPNPTTNFITINTEATINTIQVIDLLGKIVLTDASGSHTVDLSSLNAGVYITEVTTTDGVFQNRVVKK
jgi:hypothetical protein